MKRPKPSLLESVNSAWPGRDTAVYDEPQPLPIGEVLNVLTQQLGPTLATETLANDAARRDRAALGIVLPEDELAAEYREAMATDEAAPVEVGS